MKKNNARKDQQVRAMLYAERVTDMPLIAGYSLHEQEERLQQFCRINGFTVVGTYRDTVTSDVPEGARPGFSRLLQDIDDRPDDVNALLVVTWRRFYRDHSLACIMRSYLRSFGVIVQAIDEPLRVSGELAEKIMAHYYDAVSDVN